MATTKQKKRPKLSKKVFYICEVKKRDLDAYKYLLSDPQ